MNRAAGLNGHTFENKWNFRECVQDKIKKKFVKENYGIDSIVKSMMHFLSQLT